MNRKIKTKNKEKGRGSGRGIHFLIGNTFSVTFNSHNVGGEWRTGEEQIMRICTRPNTILASIKDSYTLQLTKEYSRMWGVYNTALFL